MKNSQIPAVNPQLQSNKFWNLAVASTSKATSKDTELRIEGIIINDGDAQLYGTLGMPAVSPSTFKAELANCAGQDVTVWIDSPGGKTTAAANIYNALMEHKKDGAKVTVKIDSQAMSAASVIAMAGDEVLMSPLAEMMVHEPLTPEVMTGVGYADDHRKTADTLDEIGESIINAYEIKTGKSRNEIAAIMKAETIMSANAAITGGFADGMLYTGERQDEVMNLASNRLATQNAMLTSMNKLFEIAKVATVNQPAVPVSNPDDDINNNGGNEMEINNVADLKTQLPTIHDDVYNAGGAAERERLKAFDAISDKVDKDYLTEEKYKDGATAQSVLFNAVKNGKFIDASYVAKAAIDAQNVNKVPGAASDNASPDEVTGILNRAKALAEKTLGIKGGK